MDADELKRPPFGNRFLIDSESVFQHNAWDNVTWDEAQEEAARQTVEQNSTVTLTPDKQNEFESKADSFWNEFYQQHQNRFFKDRHWLFTEFPELAPSVSRQVSPTVPCMGTSQDDSNDLNCFGQKLNLIDSEENQKEPSVVSISPEKNEDRPNRQTRILEVGCGAGNTVFPILQTNNDPELFVYCCDFSTTAVELVKEHPDYNPERCQAFVCDVSSDNVEMPFAEESLDIIILIFVLSAIHPDKMQSLITTLVRFLRPGGLVLLRDYGRYDMAQLRFKKGRCLSENFYVRGDGTRVYFFTQDELRDLFLSAGLQEEVNCIDRRLQVNRSKLLKMYRVWIQCKYRKPLKKDF